jgi:ribose transport system substrate-binding protein
MKRWTCVSLAALTTAVVSGVLAAGSAGHSQQRQFVIADIPPSSTNPTLKGISDGIRIQARKLGMKVIKTPGEFDPNAQIAAVDAVIQRKVDLIVIWPLDPNGLRPALDRARKEGIPIIVIDSPKSKPYLANFNFNDIKTGFTVGKFAADRLKKPCRVGIIQGLPVVEILDERNRGLEAGAKAGGCRVIAREINKEDGNPSTAKAIADIWKVKYGSSMSGILAYDDVSASGAIASVGGSFQPIVTGIDGITLAIDNIKAGRQLATMEFPSVELGNSLAYAAWLHLNGKKVANEINGAARLVHRGNVAGYRTHEQRLKRPMNVRFVNRGGKWWFVAR